MKRETSIPFAGFYESIHSDNLDYALEQQFQDDQGNLLDAEAFNKAYWLLDWQKVHLAYVQSYVKNFAHVFGLKTLEFQELSSPREYNFTTDRIFCTIDSSEVERLYAEVDKTELNKLIAAKFTSRSGFISFYDNSLSDWGDLSQWDANQVGTLVECFTAMEGLEDSGASEIDIIFSYPHEVADASLYAGADAQFYRLCEIADEQRNAKLED